jgi:hypothetical protein
MAEINIQRKSGSHAMWWILALVALLVIGWLFFARGMDTPAQTTTSEAPPAALEFAPRPGVLATRV